MKKTSRILALFLAILITFPTFSFAMKEDTLGKTDDQIQLEEKMKEEYARQKERDITGILSALEENEEDKNDEVRVIVELNSKALVEVANDAEVTFENLAKNKKAATEKLIAVDKNNAKNSIRKKSISIEYQEDYTTLLNGFSGDVKVKDIENLSNLPEVKKVYIANSYHRPDITTKMINTAEIIDNLPDQLGHNKYKGEGMVVAVIDSGIDPSHKDFKLTDTENVKITKDFIEGFGKTLKGKYISPKVPYAYNYMDRNHNVKDTAGVDSSMHGQHVSGTVGANGEIKGVAPEAQILGMKVFSNDPQLPLTTDDAIIRALEDSIILGADVINMSLGTTAGYSIPDDAVDACIERAVENGVVASISAGNESHINAGYMNKSPLKSNPDFGVVGTPGRSENSLQVASMESKSSQVHVIYAHKENGDKEKFQINLAKGSKNDILTSKDIWEDIVDCDYGQIELMDDVEGKIVLVQRGGEDPYANFIDKIKNAESKGAAGIIVYNHEEGYTANVHMDLSGNDVKIGAGFVSYDAGVLIRENIGKLKIEFSKGVEDVPNKEFGKMSDFSSWGAGPDLELKPEITGPGGRIYSTLNSDKYGMMDGTSMSAPHVSGIAALVKQYINSDERFKGMSDFEKAKFTKLLIMNTGRIVRKDGIELNYGEEIKFSTPVSPRKQGAGLAQVHSAVSTPVTIVDSKTGQGKTELKDFNEKNFTMDYVITNHSDTNQVYKVSLLALRDQIENREITIYDQNNELYTFEDEYITLDPEYLKVDVTYGGDIINQNSGKGLIEVPKNSDVKLSVNVDFSKDGKVYENMFVDGFVVLEDMMEIQPELSVPFLGFYGDWSYGLAVDGIFTFGEESFFKNSGLVGRGFLGNHMYENLITMNPGDDNGEFYGTGNITPILSTLRNTEEIRFSILDENHKKIWNVGNVLNRRKSFTNYGKSDPFTTYEEGSWDGRVNGQIVPEGNYYYQIESKVAHERAKFNSVEYPILIDKTPPELSDVEFDFSTNTLSFTAIDKGVGLDNNSFSIQLNRKYINRDEVDKLKQSVEPGKTRFECKINEVDNLVEDKMTVRIFVDDKINNRTIEEFDFDRNNPGAYIYLDTPLPIHYGEEDIKEILNEDGYVEIQGYVANYENLKELRIFDESVENPKIVKADITFEDYVEISHFANSNKIIYKGPAYKFTTKMKFDEGHHNLRFEAVNRSGQTDSIVRDFVFDMTPPEIEVGKMDYNKDTRQFNIELKLKDNTNNYNRLILKRNNMEIFRKSSNNTFGKRIEGIEFTHKDSINLDDMFEKEIIYSLIDLSGNESGITIKIDESGNIDLVDMDIYKVHGLNIMPTGTTILGDQAYTKEYIKANPKIQKRIEDAISNGEGVIIKEDSSTYRDAKGKEILFLYLPDTIYFHDVGMPVIMCTPFY